MLPILLRETSRSLQMVTSIKHENWLPVNAKSNRVIFHCNKCLTFLVWRWYIRSQKVLNFAINSLRNVKKKTIENTFARYYNDVEQLMCIMTNGIEWIAFLMVHSSVSNTCGCSVCVSADAVFPTLFLSTTTTTNIHSANTEHQSWKPI